MCVPNRTVLFMLRSSRDGCILKCGRRPAANSFAYAKMQPAMLYPKMRPAENAAFYYYYYYENVYRKSTQKKMKNKNTHEMNELLLLLFIFIY